MSEAIVNNWYQHRYLPDQKWLGPAEEQCNPRFRIDPNHSDRTVAWCGTYVVAIFAYSYLGSRIALKLLTPLGR